MQCNANRTIILNLSCIQMKMLTTVRWILKCGSKCSSKREMTLISTLVQAQQAPLEEKWVKPEETKTSQFDYKICRLTGVTQENFRGLSRMIDIYLSSDPVASEFKVVQGRQTSQILKDFLLRPINQGLSFAAVDNETQEIIGLIINHVSHSDCGVDALARSLEDETEKELVRFWQMLGSEPEALANEKVYNIEYNIVDERYRKHGIALALGKKALQQAHELKYPLVRSECSNAYTSLIAEQMGYTKEYAFPYEDILDSKGNRVFPTVRPPHTHLNIYILYMEQATAKPYLDHIY